MDKLLATSLMAKIQQANFALNEMCSDMEALESDEERKQLKIGWANVVIEIYSHLMRPIIAQYPYLDPDAEEMKKSSETRKSN